MIDILKIVGALLAVGLPAVVSAYAMEKITGLSERLLGKAQDTFFTQSLVFSVLVETPTIYGLVLAILLLTWKVDGMLALVSALAFSVPAMAAAYGIGLVSRAGLTALSKKPNLFQKILILAVLPEVIAIYGLIIGFVVINTPDLDVWKGAIGALLMVIMAPVAVFIAQVASNAVKTLVEAEQSFSHALVLAVLPESIALYLLLVAFFVLTQ